jgi:anti-anti-sigma factor
MSAEPMPGAVSEAPSRESFRQGALLDSVAAAVVATDVEGTIRYVNAAAEELYGYPVETMVGADVMQLLVGPVERIPAEEIMAALADGRSWTGQFRVRRADGATIVVQLSDLPLWDNGSVVGVLGIAEPVTAATDGQELARSIESRSAQFAEQMRQAMESRAAIEQAKGMLIAAHGCTPDAAFRLLAERSQDSNRKVRDIAAAMVAGAQQRPPAGSPSPPQDAPSRRGARGNLVSVPADDPVTAQPVAAGHRVSDADPSPPPKADGMDNAAPGLEIARTDTSDGWLLSVGGDIDLTTAPQLHAEMLTRLQPGRVMYLNLTGVTFIDSSGLHVLLAAHRRAAQLGGHLLLTGTSARVERLLELTGTAALFTRAPADPAPGSPAEGHQTDQ